MVRPALVAIGLAHKARRRSLWSLAVAAAIHRRRTVPAARMPRPRRRSAHRPLPLAHRRRFRLGPLQGLARRILLEGEVAERGDLVSDHPAALRRQVLGLEILQVRDDAAPPDRTAARLEQIGRRLAHLAQHVLQVVARVIEMLVILVRPGARPSVLIEPLSRLLVRFDRQRLLLAVLALERTAVDDLEAAQDRVVVAVLGERERSRLARRVLRSLQLEHRTGALGGQSSRAMPQRTLRTRSTQKSWRLVEMLLTKQTSRSPPDPVESGN